MENVKVINPNLLDEKQLPAILAQISDAVTGVAESVSEQKEKQTKATEDLTMALTGMKTAQDLLTAKVEKLTEVEEEKQMEVWDSIGGVGKEITEKQARVANVWGYGNGDPIGKAMYRTNTEWTPTGYKSMGDGYMLPSDVMKMNDMLMIWGVYNATRKHGFDEAKFANSIVNSETYKLMDYELRRLPDLRSHLKAMDTTANSSWVTTQMSGQFIDRINLELKVSALFPRVTLPNRSGSFDIPLQSSAVRAYLMGENTDDTGTKISTRNLTSAKKTFTAIKHAVRMLFSDEMDEDGIVAMMPIVLDELAYAIASASDDSIINGDETATHFDSDVTTSSDINRSYDGLRSEGGTATGAAPTGSGATDISTLSVTKLRTMRKGMGKYGVMPNELAWIAGISAFIQMLSLTQVETLDKFGPNATVLKGELAKVDGAPIIVSEWMKQDLNATGYQDGVTETKSNILLVNRRGFWGADKGSPIAESDRDIATQQTQVVVSRRVDFTSLFTMASDEAVAVVGYNLTT